MYKQINPTDIPDYKYEGYIWWSHKTEPVMIHGESIDLTLFQSRIPFIIEGNLFSRDQKISISIRNIDGNYLITQIDLGKIDMKKVDDRIYWGKNDQKFQMLEIWEEHEDQEGLIANMKTLRPGMSVFAGFKK